MLHLMAVHGADVGDDLLRNRSHADSSAAGDTRRRAAGDDRRRHALRQRRARCSIRSSRSATDDARAGADRRPSTWSSGIGETREAALSLVEKYQDRQSRRPRLRSGLDAQPGGAAAAQRHRGRRATLRRLASSSSMPTPRCAPTPRVLIENRRGQSGLWGYGISGDLPIVLLQIADPSQHRSGAPARAGPRLLAAEGTGGRSGDLERRSRRLPAAAAGSDHGSDRRRRRSAT